MNNIILNTDSYKASHFKQYPPGTEFVFSYIESRGGRFDKTLFFGLQMFIKDFLSKPITKEDIDEAEELFTAHGEPFHRAGLEHILKKHGGYLPLEIKAVPEGTIVPTKNVLVTVRNTDTKCFWLTSYVETALLRAVWYPTTVATLSHNIKNDILSYLIPTSDKPMDHIGFMLNDFGSRGVSSYESSAIGGLGHLVSFMGTDNVPAIVAARKYYGATMAGFSVPAAEHSTITSWGKDAECAAYRNMIDQFKGFGNKIVAIVADSYDLDHAVNTIFGDHLKDNIVNSGARIVVRPDSGDPATTVIRTVNNLAERFGTTINSKGYKVLPDYIRVIQGDGINQKSIIHICDSLAFNKFSVENVCFGIGGGLLQQVDRDTQKFAMKASAVCRDKIWYDVYKDPKTDPGKASKKGKLMLYRDNAGKFVTDIVENAVQYKGEVLETVYKKNEETFVVKDNDSLDKIRTRGIN